MEVVMGLMANPSSSSSSCLTAPPSPLPFGNPFPHCRCCYSASAPTSPSRAAAICTDFYGWDQEKPPPSHKPEEAEASSEFAFCFYEGEWPLATADELFEEGIIRPLIPPSSTSAKKAGEEMTVSSREGRGSGGDRGEGRSSKSTVMTVKDALRDRGRNAVSSTGEASSKGRRASRSLSPLRGGGGRGGEEEEDFPKLSSCSSAMLKSGGGSKKWKLKDLFLFRSASEGRATGRGSRDPLRRYTLLPPLSPSTSSSSLFDKPINERGGAANPPSPHEMYYSAHRAASEELKRKTPLPYERHGLFGCLRFNPALQSIKKGFFHSRK